MNYRTRIMLKIEAQGRRYSPPKTGYYDCIVDSLGIRFGGDMLSSFDQCAIVRELNYADEDKRNFDSILLCESADTVFGGIVS